MYLTGAELPTDCTEGYEIRTAESDRGGVVGRGQVPEFNGPPAQVGIVPGIPAGNTPENSTQFDPGPAAGEVAIGGDDLGALGVEFLGGDPRGIRPGAANSQLG